MAVLFCVRMKTGAKLLLATFEERVIPYCLKALIVCALRSNGVISRKLASRRSPDRSQAAPSESIACAARRHAQFTWLFALHEGSPLLTRDDTLPSCIHVLILLHRRLFLSDSLLYLGKQKRTKCRLHIVKMLCLLRHKVYQDSTMQWKNCYILRPASQGLSRGPLPLSRES